MIIFNGEIFNHLKLKKKYQEKLGIFITNSDTETLLEMVSNFGFEHTLNEIKGQFAFAIWDFKLKKFLLQLIDLAKNQFIILF